MTTILCIYMSRQEQLGSSCKRSWDLNWRKSVLPPNCLSEVPCAITPIKPLKSPRLRWRWWPCCVCARLATCNDVFVLIVSLQMLPCATNCFVLCVLTRCRKAQCDSETSFNMCTCKCWSISTCLVLLNHVHIATVSSVSFLFRQLFYQIWLATDHAPPLHRVNRR